MRCAKCLLDYPSDSWETGKTYKAIDYHHNPPQFMFKNSMWEGDLIPLCRDCHVWIHQEIKKIMFKHTNLYKFVNNEDWLWKHIFGEKIQLCINEVRDFGRKIHGNS